MVRFGCAAGTHQAYIVGELAANWFCKIGISTFHLPLAPNRQSSFQASIPPGHPLYRQKVVDITAMLIQWVKCAYLATAGESVMLLAPLRCQFRCLPTTSPCHASQSRVPPSRCAIKTPSLADESEGSPWFLTDDTELAQSSGGRTHAFLKARVAPRDAQPTDMPGDRLTCCVMSDQ